jgi:two-component system response regulator FixJ
LSEPIIFVLDDHAPVRNSFVALFRSVGLESQGFATAQEFLSCRQIQGCGCLVLDVELRDMGGLELQAQLRQRHFYLPIVFVTGNADIATAVQAIRGGAVDFLEKPVQHDVLIQSVRRALARDAQARRTQHERDELLTRLATLSRRQQQILDLIVEGLTNVKIANRLGVAVKTIEFHRANIMDKIQASSTAELIRMVVTLSPPAEGRARLDWHLGRLPRVASDS